MKKTTLWVLLAAAVIVVILILGKDSILPKKQESTSTSTTPVVMSFNDCANAGYPVMESYPRQCRTPDGRLFAEEKAPSIPTYINATSGQIMVDTPKPDSVTGKEFLVTGTARGWYFEGSFPVEVLDKNGKRLVIVPAQAQSDWMTSLPVKFKATIKVPESYIGPATIVLRKDNPSGLPENDASMSYPITIEY